MRKRRSFVRPQGGLAADINVTPLVDVVLVLLIIFMVVTPLSVREIAVQHPEVEEKPQAPGEPPPDEQVVVRVTAEGGFTINSTPIRDEEYVPRLERILAAKSAGSRVLFFVADGRARYERLVRALSGARQAGAETLAMMPQPPSPP